MHEMRNILSLHEEACRRWLLGTLSNEEFTGFLQRTDGETYSISEITGQPDDFDWGCDAGGTPALLRGAAASPSLPDPGEFRSWRRDY